MFAGQEVEITVRTVEPEENEMSERKRLLLDVVNENLKNAPVISADIDIRKLIDESQYPASQ